MSELKKQSFDRQHLEMTGEEKESRTIDAETDSGIYDPLATSEVTTDANRTRNADRDAEADSGIYDPLATSEVTTDANRTRNVDRVRIPQCISDHKRKIQHTYSIIATIAIIVLIVMLVKKESCPICALCESFACPEVWHRYKGKYYYVSEKQRSWNMSLEICSSYNASLIAIDTQQELDYLGKVFDLHDYWIGLSKTDQVWKWSNGTVFIKQFPVEGEGACAYINRKGANSTICSVEKRFICSIPKHCPKAE